VALCELLESLARCIQHQTVKSPRRW
jgi:hypothetical protein